jgi:hypothetical protein
MTGGTVVVYMGKDSKEKLYTPCQRKQHRYSNIMRQQFDGMETRLVSTQSGEGAEPKVHYMAVGKDKLQLI